MLDACKLSGIHASQMPSLRVSTLRVSTLMKTDLNIYMTSLQTLNQ